VNLTETMPDIEAWMQGEVEKPCVAQRRNPLRPCGNPAEFVVYVTLRCGMAGGSRMYCCEHLEKVASERLRHNACGSLGCFRITWVERIRSAS